MATRVFDDTSPLLVYQGNWTTGGQYGEFDLTSHIASTPSVAATFGPFQGSSISVFGTIGPNQSTVHFLLDHTISSDLKHNSSAVPLFAQPLYTSPPLDPSTEHVLTFNILDPGTFTLDFIIVGNVDPDVLNGGGTDYPPSSTPLTTPTITSTSTPALLTDVITASSSSSLGSTINTTSTITSTPAAGAGAVTTGSLSSSSSFFAETAQMPSGLNPAQSTASSSAVPKMINLGMTQVSSRIVGGAVAGGIIIVAGIGLALYWFLWRRYWQKTNPVAGPPEKRKKRPILSRIRFNLTPHSHDRPLLPRHGNRSSMTSIRSVSTIESFHTPEVVYGQRLPSPPTPVVTSPDVGSPVVDIARTFSGMTFTTNETSGGSTPSQSSFRSTSGIMGVSGDSRFRRLSGPLGSTFHLYEPSSDERRDSDRFLRGEMMNSIQNPSPKFRRRMNFVSKFSGLAPQEADERNGTPPPAYGF
ncbi:hypothetical protein BD410DRAFT_839411 [Rickenella mellea]|uniref:Mid2 domain-containing protein n=1 Tax=Rickenella mellea TaxID=50990 RepID=A0A4Y7Q4V7_9AGAM|nr:hypothetical protein BD410DRAFT_839411 [Rickenella mellea]